VANPRGAILTFRDKTLSPAAHDIGHRFLEHTLYPNEVLVELVLKLTAFGLALLGQLPDRPVPASPPSAAAGAKR
jgi:hypothetical protein